MFIVIYFFFFKQKTAYEMRISDWSSDVCSSDLTFRTAPVTNAAASEARNWYAPASSVASPQRSWAVWPSTAAERFGLLFQPSAIGESNQPGATTLTVMPAGARSSASYLARPTRSEAPTSELQSLMPTSYAGVSLKNKTRIVL